MTWKREALEKIDGYDRDLAYGEDMDIGIRAQEAGIKSKNMDAVEYITLPQSLSEVFRQGRWYGKSMMRLFKKYPKTIPSLASFGYFLVWPVSLILSFFNRYVLYLALLQSIFVGLYVIKNLFTTKNIHTIFVPVIKVIRSYGEFIGLVESLKTSDFGRD